LIGRYNVIVERKDASVHLMTMVSRLGIFETRHLLVGTYCIMEQIAINTAWAGEHVDGLARKNRASTMLPTVQ